MQIYNIFLIISDFLERILFYEFFGFPFLLILLTITGLYFSFALKFPAVRYFKYAITNIIDDKDEEVDGILLKSEQSLLTSLSSVIGMGCIAGVATAVHIGGPGSIFWLMVIAFFGMNTSLAEILLAIKYSEDKTGNKNDNVECAPLNYIRNSLADLNFKKIGIFLSVTYCILYFMGLVGGQIYQIEEAVNLLADFKVLEKYRIVITTILSGIVVFSICGNITRIAKIFEKLLPFACCSYLLCVFVILIFNITKLPHSILIIIKEAFRLRSVTGGIVGAMCTGIKRGIFSNEAGLGSSTTPYTITKAKNALKPASIGSLNPFFVSIICVATGLIIVSSDVYLSGDGGNGIVLTKNAFASVFSWFPYVLTFIITLLAISIGISSAFNSQIIYEHFLGKKTLFVYRIILFLVMMSSNFLDLNEVINMVDTFYLSIAIPNIICLFLSRNIIKNYLLDCEKNIN